MKRLCISRVGLVILGIALVCGITAPAMRADSARGPWKVEITLYDNPAAARMYVGDATLLPRDVLVVPVTWWPRADVPRYEWYEEGDAVSFNLISRDRGLSWQICDGPPLPEKAFRRRDGSRLRITPKPGYYGQHPNSERAKYVAMDYYLYPIPEKDMFAITLGFDTHVSTDGGQTWKTSDLILPHQADINGYGMATAKRLSDGTLLMPTYGRATRRNLVRSCSVARSTDDGRTWELIPVAFDDSPRAIADKDYPEGSDMAGPPPGVHAFDEAQVLETGKAGRVILVVEEQFTKDLYVCISEDRGQTWTKPRETGMHGVTPLLLRLKSGAIACAYTNRYHGGENERGMFVVYSHDGGDTWDAAHPAILRDYNARADSQCLWNFVQFSDGTLFASGWGLKTGGGGGNEISYAVGFRFTEDFRTPLRVVPHRGKP
jgi:hypothetical protein